MSQDNRLCVEYVTFKLKQGTSVDELLQRSHKLDTSFLAHENGFVSRKLLLLHDGETWADLVFWKNAAAAKAVEAKFMNDPVSKAYAELVEMESVRMEHFNEMSHFDMQS